MNFLKDKKEIFLRGWWLAEKTIASTRQIFSLTAISSWIEDVRFQEQDRKIFLEIIGYTISFVLNRLRNDIEKAHGWTNETHELNISYKVGIAYGFAQAIGNEKESSFLVDLFQDYYAPEYNDNYDKFWGINYLNNDEKNEIEDDKIYDSQINTKEDLWRTLDAFVEEDNKILAEEERKYNKKFNIERYYAYRLGKILKIADVEKVINNVKEYKNIGVSYYEDAFINLSTEQIEREFKKMVNKKNDNPAIQR
jgi:hypothetical protein